MTQNSEDEWTGYEHLKSKEQPPNPVLLLWHVSWLGLSGLTLWTFFKTGALTSGDVMFVTSALLWLFLSYLYFVSLGYLFEAAWRWIENA